MRIALVKRRYSLRHGGSERYCVNLARRLTALGHDVTVIGVSIDDDLRGEVTFVPVAVNRLTSWTNNRSFAENAGRAAQTGGYDVAYCLGRALGVDAVRVTERLQSHWVNVRYSPEWWRRVQHWNPRHRTLIGLEREIYRAESVRRIVTQSQLDRRMVIEYYGIPESKVRTIYNGVDTGTFHPGVRDASGEVRRRWNIPPEAPLLLFASMDFDGKGLRTILRAISQLNLTDSHLLVLGNGPIRKFKRLAGELGIARRVVFAGRQDGIERCYGAADLALLPTAYEPFPNVNLEAMACGTPVLTTTTSGSADVVVEGETGYFLSGVDAVDDIREGIERHLDLSAEDRRRMSARCWETARAMTIERNVRQTLEVFEEVLRENVRLRKVG
ncbi:MAG: glycosyltransferase family 4 protein [Planctomycetaceae bacterium]